MDNLLWYGICSAFFEGGVLVTLKFRSPCLLESPGLGTILNSASWQGKP